MFYSRLCIKACPVKETRVHDHAHIIQGNQSVCVTQTTGKCLEANTLKHKREKSETMGLQYINKKDLRMTIGTWNVAGKHPDDDLEIDEWLCIKEPVDIYILGFEEVVPLNAGNVLGAETRKLIPKWDKIIRKTLNTPKNHVKQKTKHKSDSTPPSPVLRTSSAADILADEIDNPGIDSFCRCQHNVELRDAVFEHQCQMCCIYCGETIPRQSCTTQRADQQGISRRRSDSNVAGKSQQSPIFVQIQDEAVENL